MEKKTTSAMMLTLLLTSMLTLAFNIQPVKSDYVWTETIYIRADGSIEPPEAPIITADNVTYTLTDNIIGAIPESIDAMVVERDGITLDGAGYTLQDTIAGGSKGVLLLGRENVTVQNMRIRDFDDGIYLWYSFGDIVSGNEIADNAMGVTVDTSHNNTIDGNNFTTNTMYTMYVVYSSDNTITGNNIADNSAGISLTESSNGNNVTGNRVTGQSGFGILLGYSSNNIIAGNDVADNKWGISLQGASNNWIFHNNFIDNTHRVYPDPEYVNVWDDGYPSGGNYWSDYAGVDVYSGAYQNETGSDRIGDTPYVINAENLDNYPLMHQWPPRHDIAITDVIPSKTVVGQGCSMSTNVTLANQGDYTETFNVTVYSGDPFNYTFYDPFDFWNYTEAWTYYDPDATEGYVNVSDGTLYVSGYGPPYQEGGLTTIKEFNYPITVETRLRPTYGTSHSPELQFGTMWSPGCIWFYYDMASGGWNVQWIDTTGSYKSSWGGSITVGTWYKLKLVITEIDLKAYLDDVLMVNATWSPPPAFAKTVSLRSSYGEYGGGDFDWVRIIGKETGIGTKTAILTSGTSTTLTFTWNTAGFAKGNYTISAYAWPVPGETDIEDNTFVDGYAFVTIPGDVNGDKRVNILDCILIANHFGHADGDGHTPGSKEWLDCVNCDINSDAKTNVLDCIVLSNNFGQNWT